MLVLSRKVGESVRLAEHTTVVVLGIQGKSVRLAFRAPASVPVYREELHERVRLAATSPPGVAQGHTVTDLLAGR
jgi:carbon storage regulator